MFSAFSRIAEEERVDGRVLRRCGKAPHGSVLWFACKRGWPLQALAFDVTVATARKLCGLEEILLHIHQAMADAPPDSQTIADELAIADSFFVDEVITDLIRLGALEADQTGRILVTNLGCEYYSRGEIPSQSRKQRIVLWFDTIKGEFPDGLILSDDEQGDGEASTLRSIVRDYGVADARRIDLDTLRKAAGSQRVLSGEDTVILDAEPAEPDSEAGLRWKEVYVFVFLDDHGRISLRVRDLKSESTTKWFQDAIDDRFKRGGIDLGHLLGRSAADTATHADTHRDLNGLSLIPIHQVQERILSAVREANEFVSIQANSPGDNGHVQDLWKAIQEVADRGIRCGVLWGGTRTHDNLLVHENIAYYERSTAGHESLIVDESIAFAAFVTQATLPNGGPATSVVTVGQSDDPSVCRKLKQEFLEKCTSGKLLDLTKMAAGSQGRWQSDNESGQRRQKTMVHALSKEKAQQRVHTAYIHCG